MSTPLRIEVPNGIYHVTARGNSQETIYRDDLEREVFLALLEKARKKYGWIVLAYCLMGNHYHLVLRTTSGWLSQGFCELNSGFARVMNLRHGRRDHVFGRRFWSELIDRETRMLETARYVVLNPVRAGICELPEQWPWSSYRACAGLEFARPLLAADELLGHFGEQPERARTAYCRFVSEGRVRVAATENGV
jgi:putative transposase